MRRLAVLNISRNPLLTELCRVGGAPSLTHIIAGNCGLCNVDGLPSCPQLTDFEAFGNRRLKGLHGLAGAPRLERIAVRCCGLCSLDGRGSCPSLIGVDMCRIRLVRDLHGLAGTLHLEKVFANTCGLLTTDGLKGCSRPRKAHLCCSQGLTSVITVADVISLGLLAVVSCHVFEAPFLSPTVTVRKVLRDAPVNRPGTTPGV